MRRVVLADPGAIGVAVHPCGREIADPAQWPLLDLIAERFQDWIVAIAIGWDGDEQMGDALKLATIRCLTCRRVEGEVSAVRRGFTPGADDRDLQGRSQSSEAAAAETGAEDAELGTRRQGLTAVDKRILHKYKRITCHSVVTGSCLSLVSSQGSMLPRREPVRRARAEDRQETGLLRGVMAVAAAALVSSAFLLAPEQPEEQASICRQHLSADACRVW